MFIPPADLWSVQATTGDRPPALSYLTLTKIDQHRAALFGGYGGSWRHNDTYVLDMATWVWEICMYTHNTLCCTTSACGQRLHVAVHCSFWSISRDGYYFTHQLLNYNNNTLRGVLYSTYSCCSVRKCVREVCFSCSSHLSALV